MTPLRTIIFDFDGVIVESNDVKTAAFADVFARFPDHAAGMMEFHHANVSMSRFAKFDHLLHRLGRPDDTGLRDDLAADFSRRTVTRVIESPFVAGAEDALEELSARVPIYIASVTPQADLEAILDARGLRRYFAGIYGCPPWTKPNAVRDVLAIEKCLPAEAALIGDSEGDRRAAAETGVEFIARDSGLSFDEPPATLHSDLRAIASHLRQRIRDH